MCKSHFPLKIFVVWSCRDCFSFISVSQNRTHKHILTGCWGEFNKNNVQGCGWREERPTGDDYTFRELATVGGELLPSLAWKTKGERRWLHPFSHHRPNEENPFEFGVTCKKWRLRLTSLWATALGIDQVPVRKDVFDFVVLCFCICLLNPCQCCWRGEKM